MQKISPCLWFDTQAEEAANFYVSVFRELGYDNSRVKQITHYGDTGPMPKGMVMTVIFELDGQEYMGINGGPAFKFSEAVSFIIYCDTQDEIDAFWEKLIAGGGEEVECGWLTDKFGLSWQINPSALPEMMKDDETSDKIMSALVKMKKLNLAELKKAAGQ